MSKNVEVIEREMEYTLEIKAEAAMWKMPMLIGKSYKSIAEYMAKKNVECSSAPFVRYMNVNWEEVNKMSKFMMFLNMFTYKWNMLIGFPVKEKVNGEGIITAGILQKGKYIKAIHKGAYQKVGDTYAVMTDYINANNIKIRNESIELYTNDPQTTKKEDLETVVLIPFTE
jgi:effector-binding domain-containing protein